MTDEQFIELLRKIKVICKGHEDCNKCIFENNYEMDGCIIKALIAELNWNTPDNWNMDEIERIIRL